MDKSGFVNHVCDISLNRVRTTNSLKLFVVSYMHIHHRSIFIAILFLRAVREHSKPAKCFLERIHQNSLAFRNALVYSVKAMTRWQIQRTTRWSDKCRQKWPNVDKSGQIWTNLDKSGQISTNLDKSGQISTNLDKSRQISTNLDKSRQISTRQRPGYGPSTD